MMTYIYNKGFQPCLPVPPEQLKYLARWAELECDAHWHTSLGCMLFDLNHEEAASFHYQQAIELGGSKAWHAMECLAHLAGDAQKYGEAIDWQEKAIEALPSNLTHIRSVFWCQVAAWADCIGDEDKALAASRAGFDVVPHTEVAVGHYLKRLHESGKIDEFWSTLRYLGTVNDPRDKGKSLLHRQRHFHADYGKDEFLEEFNHPLPIVREVTRCTYGRYGPPMKSFYLPFAEADLVFAGKGKAWFTLERITA